MSFELLSEKLQKLIAEKGFIEPTLPQKIGIPAILKGGNVLIIAPTGIGKTESAMLPLLDKVHREKLKPVAILYITPLKSLNRDLLDRLFWWCDRMELDIAVRHGDTSAKERAEQREMPSEILITTPESLQAILTGKKMKEHLRNVKTVIVDEVHELVNSKRGIQLSVGLERLRELAGDFQRIGLSATVGSPGLVADFLGGNAAIVNAETTKDYDIKVEMPKPTPKDRLLSDELLIGADTAARLRRVLELIESHKSIIVFTNTRETAEVLASRLSVLDKELKHAVHHGSLSKEHRIKSEKAFKIQELKALIATSSLELGIDVGSVNLVVQYLSPRQVTRLIQRVGRSGHRVNQTSKGIIISGDEDLFESAVIARRASERALEEVKIHDMAMDVLAGQILGLSLDEYGISEDKICRIIKRSYPYRNIRKEDVSKLLDFMEGIKSVWIDRSDGVRVRRRLKSWKSYFENLSTIPDTRQYKIISIIANEFIGELDEAFVAEHCNPGEKFICSGRAWKVIQIEGQKVVVEPIEDIESSIPAWEGELIPVPYEVAEEVGALRDLISKRGEKALEKYNVDGSSAEKMEEIVKKHAEKHLMPDDKNFLIENYKDFVIIHSCSGSLVNETLGKYLAAAITTETGVSVNIKTDPYRIILQTVVKMEKVKEILENASGIEDMLVQELERSSLFKWRFLQVAKRFGVIYREADFQKISLNRIIASYYNTPVYAETLREIFLEKMDVRNAKKQLEKIKSGGIRLHVQEGLSYLGELGLVHQFSDVMKPALPKEEIFSAFKRRLLGTRVRLICANCADYSIAKIVRDVEKQPECPKCTSRLMAVVYRGNRTAQSILRKRKGKKELTEDEMKELQRVRRTADLVIVYGRSAVEALAGRGVGPETAARILSKLHTNKEDLYKDILQAEKDFVRTKRYWKG